MASIFGIFLVRQYALSIPDDLLDAARIDGAERVPDLLVGWCCRRSRRSWSTLAIFTFLGAWNDFMWPLIVLSDERLYTLPVALANLVGEHVQDTELMMAGSVVTVLPVLLLFLCVAAVLHRRHHRRQPQRLEDQRTRWTCSCSSFCPGSRSAAFTPWWRSPWS